MIVDIQPSPVKYKRYRVTMDNGKEYDFGLDTGSTYIDHHNKIKRLNYWSRHYSNPTERRLIDNLVPSPALFSALLLWGESTDINKNINHLNMLWKQKHSCG
jgi:hypothetical protein